MATTKVTPIQFLRSLVFNKRPDPTKLLPGQPAVNTAAAQPGLFFGDDTGTTLFKVGPCAVGFAAPNAGATGPGSGNTRGELWLDKRTSELVTASNLTANVQYKIVFVGTTDFTTIGAPSNTVGTSFTATGPATGNGTASYVGVIQPYPVLRVWDGTSWVSCMPYIYANTIVADTAPAVTDHFPGTLWWNSSTGLMYILYNDGTTKQWAQVSSSTVS